MEPHHPHDRIPRSRLVPALVGGIVLLSLIAALTLVLARRCGQTDVTVEPPAALDSGRMVDSGADAVAPDLTPPPPPKPRPRRRVRRAIRDEELLRVQRLNSASIRVCYHRAARHGNRTAPRANVTVDLGAGGVVQSVSVDAGEHKELARCVRQAVRGWRFPASLRAQQLRFPVLYR